MGSQDRGGEKRGKVWKLTPVRQLNARAQVVFIGDAGLLPSPAGRYFGADALCDRERGGLRAFEAEILVGAGECPGQVLCLPADPVEGEERVRW